MEEEESRGKMMKRQGEVDGKGEGKRKGSRGEGKEEGKGWRVKVITRSRWACPLLIRVPITILPYIIVLIDPMRSSYVRGTRLPSPGSSLLTHIKIEKNRNGLLIFT